MSPGDNVAAAEPTLVGRLLAAWPPVVLCITAGHLDPLHDALRCRVRIARRQLWGNTAAAFAGSLRSSPAPATPTSPA